MTRNDLRLSTIVNVVAWCNANRRFFIDDADAMMTARRHFHYLPASIVVAAVLIAQDDADAAFWDRMEDIAADAAPMVQDFDAAMLANDGADLDPIPF